MRRVLVTGATGFVGAHLVRALLDERWSVRTSIRDESRIAELPPAVEPALVGDLGRAVWDSALQGTEFVIHLAGKVHTTDKGNSSSAETEFQEVNVTATSRLAKAAAANGVKRFIFASTVKAIGEYTSPGQLWNEESPCNPETLYGKSKLEAEAVLKDVGLNSGLETVVLRLPLVYGPGVKANYLRLMQVVMDGWPLPLASVQNRRSLLYVGNLTSAILRCLTDKEMRSETFLISDGQDVSTPELIRLIARGLRRPARLVSFPEGMLRFFFRIGKLTQMESSLMDSLALDIGKIRRKLCWNPPFEMEDGINATAAWFKAANAGSPFTVHRSPNKMSDNG
ncbi:MAG: NAD-dependent epimerase/dehydratase family protein [Pseudomonadota bacterium]